ncbi:MAG TPA: hypothetical protein VGS07_18580 [Thermoanaerobaculia bacterium]|jgi:hypothetical protein|nr:hypothetical protein [Thermoanaerobaculia bacterium]
MGSSNAVTGKSGAAGAKSGKAGASYASGTVQVSLDRQTAQDLLVALTNALGTGGPKAGDGKEGKTVGGTKGAGGAKGALGKSGKS